MRVDYHQRLVPVIRYLEQHFNEPLNLPEVAALANLSPYHFHRTFKPCKARHWLISFDVCV